MLFASTHLLLVFRAQIYLTLEYCSHVWARTSSAVINLLEQIQQKSVRLISLASNIQLLSYRRSLGSRLLFYLWRFDFCSLELALAVFLPWFSLVVLVFRRQIIRTKSSILKCRSSLFQSFFTPPSSKLWNTIPRSAFSTTYNLSIFETRINKLKLTWMSHIRIFLLIISFGSVVYPFYYRSVEMHAYIYTYIFWGLRRRTLS